MASHFFPVLFLFLTCYPTSKSGDKLEFAANRSAYNKSTLEPLRNASLLNQTTSTLLAKVAAALAKAMKTIMKLYFLNITRFVNGRYNITTPLQKSELEKTLTKEMTVNKALKIPSSLPQDPITLLRSLDFVGRIMEERKKKCKQLNGVYDVHRGACRLENRHGDKNISRLIYMDHFYTSQDAYAFHIIVIVGNTISIVSLLALIVMYARRKELQTFPGKCLMSFSTSLLGAQAFQLVTQTKLVGWICVVTGITLHWVYNVTFLWTLVIAWDLYWHLGKFKHGTRRCFRRYCCVVYIMSFTPIGISILIAELVEKDLGYGMDGICFISSIWSNLFTFVLPLAAVLTFNSFACIYSLRGIYRTRRSIEARTKTTSHPRGARPRTTVLIGVKLSILLGLPWIIGYAGKLTRSKVLVYVFLVLTSFQGLFIFLGFVQAFKSGIEGLKKVRNVIRKEKATGSDESDLPNSWKI